MKIAVVIPCYNVEHYIGIAVKSVLDQTYDDLDMYIVDDGSTDGTRDRIAQLDREYPGLFRWESVPRRGACACRNIGLAKTSGDYVQFLDADDTILTDKLHRQIALAKVQAFPDLVVGDFRNVFEDGHEDTITGLGERPWMALIRTQLGTTSANLFKRNALEQMHGWREDQASSQDYELMFRMLKNGASVGWDPNVSSLVLKRSKGSISRTGQSGNWKRYVALRREIRDHLINLDSGRFSEELNTVDQHLFMAIRVLSKFDAAAALEEYRGTVAPGFRPDRTSATTALYGNVYRLFGFRAAERLAKVMGWFKGQPTPN